MMSKLHTWDLSSEDAIRIQNKMRERHVLDWDGRPVRTIGGVDVSVKTEAARAAIVVIRFPELTPFEAVTADAPLVFPYLPGLEKSCRDTRETSLPCLDEKLVCIQFGFVVSYSQQSPIQRGDHGHPNRQDREAGSHQLHSGPVPFHQDRGGHA